MIGVGSVMRMAAVFGAATAGSLAGRIAAASLYGEPVGPLLEIDGRTLLDQDVAPGFLAAELLGRNLRIGIAGEILTAALGAAASQVATGPLVDRKAPADSGR